MHVRNLKHRLLALPGACPPLLCPWSLEPSRFAFKWGAEEPNITNFEIRRALRYRFQEEAFPRSLPRRDGIGPSANMQRQNAGETTQENRKKMKYANKKTWFQQSYLGHNLLPKLQTIDRPNSRSSSKRTEAKSWQDWSSCRLPESSGISWQSTS